MVGPSKRILVQLQVFLNKKFIVPNKKMLTHANAKMTALRYFTPLQYYYTVLL